MSPLAEALLSTLIPMGIYAVALCLCVRSAVRRARQDATQEERSHWVRFLHSHPEVNAKTFLDRLRQEMNKRNN
jgi:hypothetical protein